MTRTLDPKRIEEKSFKIIDELLPNLALTCQEKEVVKRVVHATADLDYTKDLLFHPQAIKAGLAAIRAGKNIVVDVNMVKVGIDQRILIGFGGKVICLLNDKEVIQQSSKLKITRAILAMRKAAYLMNGGIAAIGNAPTALFELCDLIKQGKTRPALIIGVPVGFVGACESKRKLSSLSIACITNRSRKGGSSVAVAIVNALLKMAKRAK